MANQRSIVVDNQFVGGLKTEFTGLNFPDNSVIETYDCVFTRTGLVRRRLGINYEVNNEFADIDVSNKAISSYWWRNSTGDGTVSLYVLQVGTTIYFYEATSITSTAPLSTFLLATTVDLDAFKSMPTVDATFECQYADGNGKLFIFHPHVNTIYCEFESPNIVASSISVKIRDTIGIEEEGVDENYRPKTLTEIHKYNLANQGWNASWTTTSTTENDIEEGELTWTVDEDLPIREGDRVVAWGDGSLNTAHNIGIVTSYAGDQLIVDVTTIEGTGTIASWKIAPQPPLIDTWYEAIHNYPSNSDVWWYFKDQEDKFNPEDTIDNITTAAGQAPAGFFILDAFNQDRSEVSGIPGLDVVSTEGLRPTTGTWFQSRIWYTGVNHDQFHEKIYFSQIIEKEGQLGKCYQTNDPTSQDRFDPLPSDGGVIVIQGSGRIHKLFPLNNGLLVFADKGIWFITGSTGIGFTANDYTVVDVERVQTLSPYSFVSVQGKPVFWNQEGIYTVTSGQAGFQVTSMTNTTIAKFFQDIPLISKYYARGYYDPITFQLQFLYRDEAEVGISNRYSYQRILNFDTQINAFYPWTIDTSSTNKIHGLVVLGGTGTNQTTPQEFKYLSTSPSGLGFAISRDTTYEDWGTSDYTSYFITGYRVYTKGITFAQLPYIEIYSNEDPSVIGVQGRWDYTTSGNTGQWSTVQKVYLNKYDRSYQSNKIRIRGRGKAVQLRFSSISGEPMSIIGWVTLVEGTASP